MPVNKNHISSLRVCMQSASSQAEYGSCISPQERHQTTQQSDLGAVLRDGKEVLLQVSFNDSGVGLSA
ncbi:hypothetical protein JHK82_040803 [Glycine max]|nr:hypothetical protein JHK85_041620 [Glycine max]KAG5111580.1 hypothetical protein JHK82_040803 [Glycine max]